MQKEHGIIHWKSLTIEYAAITDRGKIRQHNEDGYLLVPDEAFFCVADGAGGHSSGAQASSIVLGALKDVLTKPYQDGDRTQQFTVAQTGYDEVTSLVQPIVGSVNYANSCLYRENKGKITASTLVGCQVFANTVTFVNVGDSRGYLFREGELNQITRDHSLVAQLLRDNKITRNQVETHPQKNIITRAMGVESRVEVDTFIVPVQDGDAILLCSDGLTGMISEEAIAHTLASRSPKLETVSTALCSQALEAGGRDNITAILLRLQSV